MTVRYTGRVYDVVMYESAIVVERPVTIAKLQEAGEQAKRELQMAHPSILLDQEGQVVPGYGHNPPIIVLHGGRIWECVGCGRVGHPLERCPQKSE